MKWGWLAVPLAALAFLAATWALRVRRVDFVSHEAGGAPAAALNANGAWQPALVIPGHRDKSYEWLDLTRQMFARHQLRVRHIDYENAPSGHDVHDPSPYRWWLGLAALWRHASSTGGYGACVEWAALYADPLLLLLGGAATLAFAYRRSGAFAAALTAALLGFLYPFASLFLPAVPDDQGLSALFAIWTLLPLVAGCRASAEPAAARRWFIAGGIIGGAGLWVSVARELPILAGAGIGALLAGWVSRPAGGASPAQPLPWRSWGLAGAWTCLAAYLAEFFPSHMGDWELRVIHPLLGVAWLGCAELTGRLASWIGGRRPGWSLRGVGLCLLSLLGAASLPAALVIEKSLGFLAEDLPTMRLTLLSGGPAAPSLWAWLVQNGFTSAIAATFLPFVLLVPAVAVLAWRKFAMESRRAVAIAVAPVAVAIGLSFRQIAWWNQADAALIVVVLAMAAAIRAVPSVRYLKAAMATLAAMAAVLGAILLLPSSDVLLREGVSSWTHQLEPSAVNESEAITLVERDMAHWIAGRVGPAGGVVVAPPGLTTTLYYYGGVRGLATFGWEDHDGFQAAVRILSATTPEEAQELIGIHGVTHIIIPSWDPFMDAYAQVGAGQVGGTFLERLHEWNLPRWLTPVPYLVPGISGFEGQSAIVFEVVDEQDDASALSRITEYFVEMNQLTLAKKAAGGLRRFPADLGAMVARAEVEYASGDADLFAGSVAQIIRRIGSNADRDLAWDQRLGLCVVLVQGHHSDLALPRLRECLANVDEGKLRSLSTTLLYRLQLMSKGFGLGISDPRLRSLSLELLPADLRSRAE